MNIIIDIMLGYIIDWDMGVSENSVPLNPMVLLIIISIKWLFHWEYTLFSDKPKWFQSVEQCSFKMLQVLFFADVNRVFRGTIPPCHHELHLASLGHLLVPSLGDSDSTVRWWQCHSGWPGSEMRKGEWMPCLLINSTWISNSKSTCQQQIHPSTGRSVKCPIHQQNFLLFLLLLGGATTSISNPTWDNQRNPTLNPIAMGAGGSVVEGQLVDDAGSENDENATWLPQKVGLGNSEDGLSQQYYMRMINMINISMFLIGSISIYIYTVYTLQTM